MAAIGADQLAELLSAIVRQSPRDIDSVPAQHWIENQDELALVLRSTLCQPGNRTTVGGVAPAVSSQWLDFFRHLRVWDNDFNQSHFPLGEDPGDEAEEYGFDRLVTGREALAEFARLGREPASLWAQGRYIKAHPAAQQSHPLVGIGAKWRSRVGGVWFPIFYWGGDEPYVDLDSLGGEFYPNCRFLLRKGS